MFTSLYDINLQATTTTILDIRGVTISINLVSRTTDSIRRSIVLFKPVLVRTSDPKSEFLCQSSLYCAEPADPPWTTSYAWDISHTLTNMYHPYCHSPSALTKYLKAKLRAQHAKHLSRSLTTPVEQNIPLKHNIAAMHWLRTARLSCRQPCSHHFHGWVSSHFIYASTLYHIPAPCMYCQMAHAGAVYIWDQDLRIHLISLDMSAKRKSLKIMTCRNKLICAWFDMSRKIQRKTLLDFTCQKWTVFYWIRNPVNSSQIKSHADFLMTWYDWWLPNPRL